MHTPPFQTLHAVQFRGPGCEASEARRPAQRWPEIKVWQILPTPRPLPFPILRDAGPALPGQRRRLRRYHFVDAFGAENIGAVGHGTGSMRKD